MAESALINALGGQGVVHVGNRDNSAGQRNLVPRQPKRITGAIVPLVMSADEFGGLLEERNISHQLATNLNVPLHECEFVISQWTWFEENAVRYGQFADIVEPCTHGQGLKLYAERGEFRRYFCGVTENSPGMSGGRRIAQINRAAEGFQGCAIAVLKLQHRGLKLLGTLSDHLLQVASVLIDFALERLVL